MADNKNATRIEIETNQRGLSSVEIQELSKREMEDVTGGEHHFTPMSKPIFRDLNLESSERAGQLAG